MGRSAPYGAADGSEACDFLSDGAIATLGGVAACREEFAGVPSADFDVQEVSVVGTTATVQVQNQRSDQVIDLELVDERGSWKVSNYPGLAE